MISESNCQTLQPQLLPLPSLLLAMGTVASDSRQKRESYMDLPSSWIPVVYRDIVDGQDRFGSAAVKGGS